MGELEQIEETGDPIFEETGDPISRVEWKKVVLTTLEKEAIDVAKMGSSGGPTVSWITVSGSMGNGNGSELLDGEGTKCETGRTSSEV